jgi:uncharacterized protein
MIVFWRRTDVEALERLTLVVGARGVRVVSTVISVAAGGYRLDHVWELTPTGVPSRYRSSAWVRTANASSRLNERAVAGALTATVARILTGPMSRTCLSCRSVTRCRSADS